MSTSAPGLCPSTLSRRQASDNPEQKAAASGRGLPVSHGFLFVVVDLDVAFESLDQTSFHERRPGLAVPGEVTRLQRIDIVRLLFGCDDDGRKSTLEKGLARRARESQAIENSSSRSLCKELDDS